MFTVALRVSLNHFSPSVQDWKIQVTVKQFACIEYGIYPARMLMDKISFFSVHQILQFSIYLINGAVF
jgi:hypothetical protein